MASTRRASSRSAVSKTAKKTATKKSATKKNAAKKATAKSATKSKARTTKVKTPPSTAEVDSDTLEFIDAIDKYKKKHGRPFPSWSEVLQVLLSLGYRKA